MYRATDQDQHYQVFTEVDPRAEGFEGEVEADVTLNYPQSVYDDHEGEPASDEVIGRTGPRAYRVFRSARERDLAGAERVSGSVFVAHSWADYLQPRVAAYDNSANE
jgi:hypothetical protein